MSKLGLQDQPEKEVACVAAGPLHSLIAAGGVEGLVKLYDHRSPRLVGTFKGHEEGIFSVAFSSTGLLASTSLDGTVRSWDCRAACDSAVGNSSGCINVMREHGDIVSPPHTHTHTHTYNPHPHPHNCRALHAAWTAWTPALIMHKPCLCTRTVPVLPTHPHPPGGAPCVVC